MKALDSIVALALMVLTLYTLDEARAGQPDRDYVWEAQMCMSRWPADREAVESSRAWSVIAFQMQDARWHAKEQYHRVGQQLTDILCERPIGGVEAERVLNPLIVGYGD